MNEFMREEEKMIRRYIPCGGEGKVIKTEDMSRS